MNDVQMRKYIKSIDYALELIFLLQKDKMPFVFIDMRLTYAFNTGFYIR